MRVKCVLSDHVVLATASRAPAANGTRDEDRARAARAADEHGALPAREGDLHGAVGLDDSDIVGPEPRPAAPASHPSVRKEAARDLGEHQDLDEPIGGKVHKEHGRHVPQVANRVTEVKVVGGMHEAPQG